MAQRYALFFDIDGTLVSFKTHEIPPSAILALTQAKANGSRVYIATGRPPIIITNLGAIEHLIDGYITTNGALCYVGDEMVCCQPIAKDDVMTSVKESHVNDDVTEKNIQNASCTWSDELRGDGPYKSDWMSASGECRTISGNYEEKNFVNDEQTSGYSKSLSSDGRITLTFHY